MKINLKPSRYPSRSTTDHVQIKSVLDEALFCTVAYIKDGVPYQLPTGFVRYEDQLIIHGSSKSDFLEAVMQAKQVSISVILFDGLVLEETAFDHSINYRSVILFASPKEVDDPREQIKYLEAFTNKMVPGRMKELPDITQSELRATRLLAFDLGKASLKIREGGSGSTSDTVWTGTIPAHISYELPLSNPAVENHLKIPDYLTKMIIKSSG